MFYCQFEECIYFSLYSNSQSALMDYIYGCAQHLTQAILSKKLLVTHNLHLP